jgi:hypothetical protein
VVGIGSVDDLQSRLFNSLRLQWSRLGPVDGPAKERPLERRSILIEIE